MAMAFHEQDLNKQRPMKIMGERMAAQRSVPARSRGATARKLEEVIAPAPEELEQEDELMPVETKPRNRASQAQANAARIKANEEAAQLEVKRLKDIEDLEARRDQLVERLDTGAARIEDARAKGIDVHGWEDYWIGLLRHYEQICDKLRELSRAY